MNTEIAEYIKNHIREYLPPEYQEAHITLEEVTKGNDRRLTGLLIRNDGEITVPTIYLEPYTKQLAQGRPMNEIMREIVQIRTEQDTRIPFEVSDLMNYGQVKPMLTIRLCDPEQNREYLKDKPFTPCGELAAVYRIQVMESKEGVASAVVTDRMMELWGVTKEQLHQDAVAAETARSPVCFYSMEDMMDEIMFSSKPENLFERTEPLDAATMPMYVLTNTSKVNGSGILARDGVLDKIGELLGKNFYVLPSSIHEVLIVPDNDDMQARELESMVKEVNATQVAPANLLSDKVQYYDRAAKTLGRKQEKGLLERLAENKAQVKEHAEKTPKAKKAAKQEPSL